MEPSWCRHPNRLLRKAYQALPVEGALIVYDSLIDDERRTNTFGMLMSVNMLIETRTASTTPAPTANPGWPTSASGTATSTRSSAPDSMIVGIKSDAMGRGLLVAAGIALCACSENGGTTRRIVPTGGTESTTDGTSHESDLAAFCEEAATILDADRILTEGADGLVDDLRSIDAAALDADESQAFEEALGDLEATLGPSPDEVFLGSWSTEEITASVGIPCRMDVPAVFIGE